MFLVTLSNICVPIFHTSILTTYIVPPAPYSLSICVSPPRTPVCEGYKAAVLSN